MQSELGWVFFSTGNEHLSCPTRVVEIHLNEIDQSLVTAISVSDHKLRKAGAGIVLGLKYCLKGTGKITVGGHTLSAKSYSVFSSNQSMLMGFLVVVSNKNQCQKLERFSTQGALTLARKTILKNNQARQVPEELKLKTLQVVKMTALGLSASEIADVLHLTNRGVDYHLSVAKQKIGAINKPNLIFEARNLGWV
ncbi:regulatory protein, luxR family [Ferrimonas sediminum]|uniref:Regulatory protein, luxR family n=1 Tax=Ferrimonas sediminum TaxID=718193 RepID=A0A1G8ZWW0_9GAMM|nr:LuxR C-terminal-related transcriptional regulator [Ferrimonas sediminum]SDK18610.1 regulatory protein, luxR family [Ferrimonas sediminum]